MDLENFFVLKIEFTILEDNCLKGIGGIKIMNFDIFNIIKENRKEELSSLLQEFGKLRLLSRVCSIFR